ncbi:HWE histidine kinase domain-containing protein [Undibacter mobilis]|uniref:Blue-light-activated histidine kinase n=1 Tax=Undibacter mobilis TaxID=2292256 RepID=A0A371B2V7_9BRAD|nr:HWE histidine kinase domain-containing protein [Undibacter mobilis]RDV01919.1 PAS domain S-box protein [Undibacter mobilis]
MANKAPSGEGASGSLLLDELQEECQRLEGQVNAQAIELNLLRARFARYETALRGSQVVVYTQDRSLRYTSISQPMLGHSVADLLGRADEDVLPESVRDSIVAIKREAVSSGQSQRIEFSLEESGALRWYDLHVEALRNDAGDIVGITCASVDVTERKEGEAHLRLLLRELTHRSKNLLAVIQAMARQTARHAGSIDSFLTQFGARLQALAASHDLLIRESWHGASLDELVRSQLVGYLDGAAQQVTIEGPQIALKPEAAQNLGLALHELSANATRFGALSTSEGRVSIEWRRSDGPDGPVEFSWRESLGPRVKPRRKRGFGTMVIETNLTRAIDAKVDMAFDPEGLQCRVVIPANQLIAALDRDGTSPPASR